MRQLLARPSDSQLSGTPLTLAQVVGGARSRAEQSRRINAYWDLCSAVSDYYLGLREAEEFKRLQQSMPREASMLGKAADELNVRLGTSLRGATASQLRLASLMNTSTLGLPGDLPYCGPYGTRHSEIFGGGGPTEARELHELLPLRYAELQGADAAVDRSEAWLSNPRGASGQAVIQAVELLALRRRAFVQIARDYNRRVTRYTELSRPGLIDNGRLVAMLIGKPETRLSSTGSGLQFRSPQ